MAKTDKCLLRKIIIDFICFGIVAFPSILFQFYVEPYKRGFFCNDESISYPYKNSSLSKPILYFVGLGCTIIIFIVTEYIISKQNISYETIANFKISPWIWECYKVIGIFLFGAACSYLTTEISKYSVGCLRPHFIDVCRPNVNCSLLENQHRYIELYSCLGKDEEKLRKMRLSFVSAHASFSSYSMVFLSMYVYARWNWRGSKLLRHVVQFAAFTFAWYTALSRVSDYKHHWSDVLAGSLQGSLVAVLIVLFVSELFSKPPRKSADTSSTLLPQTAAKTLLI